MFLPSFWKRSFETHYATSVIVIQSSYNVRLFFSIKIEIDFSSTFTSQKGIETLISRRNDHVDTPCNP